ncbi:hypothetical protein MGA3_14071 [Bacillus methanolicus MGA3]|nr:hypothetical protein MGA3_14071 [Bacillus methanolicus MGA3]
MSHYRRMAYDPEGLDAAAGQKKKKTVYFNIPCIAGFLFVVTLVRTIKN